MPPHAKQCQLCPAVMVWWAWAASWPFGACSSWWPRSQLRCWKPRSRLKTVCGCMRTNSFLRNKFYPRPIAIHSLRRTVSAVDLYDDVAHLVYSCGGSDSGTNMPLSETDNKCCVMVTCLVSVPLLCAACRALYSSARSRLQSRKL